MQGRTSSDPVWEDRAGSESETRRESERNAVRGGHDLLSHIGTREFFESFPAPLLVVDENGLVAELNKEASILMGEPADRITGRSAARYLTLNDGDAVWKKARQSPRGVRDLAGEIRAPASHVPVRVNVNPLAENGTGPLLIVLRSASRDEAVIRSLRDVAERAAHTAAGLASMGEATTKKADRIRDTMQGIADGTQVQARKVEETVEVIKDLAKNIDQISAHAVSASGRIQAQAVTAREGTEVANKAFGRLSTIVEDVQTTAKCVHELAAHVEQVEKILDFVDEVARETNLVSLNAAIEAARAGESGRAFSAVADEVKRLAAHTRESLTDTARLIDAAKQEAASVQRDTDARLQEVTVSADHIREALTRFESVANDILESSELIGSISGATMEQKRSAGAIVAAIDEVAGVAEEATKGTEDAHRMADEVTHSMQALTEASHELTGIATSLRTTLERYFQARDEPDERSTDDKAVPQKGTGAS